MWTVTPKLHKFHLSSDKTDSEPEGDQEDWQGKLCKALAQKRSSGNNTSTLACVSEKADPTSRPVMREES